MPTMGNMITRGRMPTMGNMTRALHEQKGEKLGASSVLVTSAHPAVPGHGGPDSKAIRGENFENRDDIILTARSTAESSRETSKIKVT